MSDAILLQADGDSAEILPFGAELSAWRADGVDLVWAKDPKIWDQTAPVLFPVVGWTRDAQVTVEGRKYPLALHGFAWKKCFEIAEQRADYLRLLLLDDAETHALYPFAFRFEVEFRLRKGALENNLIVTNTDPRPLPYACGLHPAFRWPLAGSTAEHAIVFERPEKPDVPVIGPGGLFMRETKHTPLSGARMPLEPEMFRRDALCFLNLASHSLCLRQWRRRAAECDARRFPPCRFLDAAAGSLSLHRAMDGIWRPGRFPRRSLREALHAHSLARGERASRRDFCL